MSLDTIGSIALHVLASFNNIPEGVSGTMVEIVDMSRQSVANYVGAEIGSNAIPAIYQPAIVSYTKADVTDLIQAQAGGESVSLAELSVNETGEAMSSKQWQMLGDMQLRSIGRKARFSRSLS